MNVELFANWLAMARQMTRDQRRQAFMTLALEEAAEGTWDGSWLATAEDGTPADDLALIGARQSDAVETQIVSGPPPTISEPVGALAAAARSRVALPGCPHCDAKDVRTWGHASGLPRYRCANCRRTFNALTGASLARTGAGIDDR